MAEMKGKSGMGLFAFLLALPIALSAGDVMRVAKSDFREGPPPERKWKLIWHDEFDGQAIDEQKWIIEPTYGWEWPGIATKQKVENCALDGNGNLVIKLTRDEDGTVRYCRGLITKSFTHSYGYYETRVQFSRQPGWWTAVWLAGHPYVDGPDAFAQPEEIDIFEDFIKPKSMGDIAQTTHFSMYTSQPGIDTTRVGFGDMLNERTIRRVSHGSGSPSSHKIVLEEYGGWHTVGMQWTPLEYIFYVDGKETHRQNYREVPMTNVPVNVWITAELRTPGKDGKPFYGRLEDAMLPDQLVVDYIRVYDEDAGKHLPPSVSLTRKGSGDSRGGKSELFEIEANAPDSELDALYLFSMGRLRAECPVSGKALKKEIGIDSLFPNYENTIIAMAKDKDGRVGLSTPVKVDVYSDRAFLGTAYQGKPQAIPGKIVAGHYDEGGNGVAYVVSRIGVKDAKCTWRANEIDWSSEYAIPCGQGSEGIETQWVTYRVDVKKDGDYYVELLMNRPDFEREGIDFNGMADDVIQLDMDNAKLAEWRLPAAWTSGSKWRMPSPIGRQRVTLGTGEHQLLLRFNRVNSHLTFFGGLDFILAK